jgi:hypothetical protein
VVIRYPPAHLYGFVSENGFSVADPFSVAALVPGALATNFYRMPTGQTISWSDDLSSRLFNDKDIPSGRYRGGFRYRKATYGPYRERGMERWPESFKLEESFLPESLLCKQQLVSNMITVDYVGWRELHAKQNQRILRETDPSQVTCYACSVREPAHTDRSLPAAALVAVVVLLGRRRIRRVSRRRLESTRPPRGSA